MNSLASSLTHRNPPVAFDRADLNIVANRALAAVGTDDRWCRAINKAVVQLATGRFMFDGHVVTIHSATTEQVYRIDCREPLRCSCKGRARGYVCYHVVAARLIMRAAELHAAALHPSCPTCQATIESQLVYIGGTGYAWVNACSGDRAHYSKRAA